MADPSSDILFDSVRFILSNWTVLQLAVEHGFGGKDTVEKAEWMVNVINQVLKENEIIETYELEDYIGEILFNEFHIVAEDGSLPKVVQKLCTFQRLWKEGNAKQIQQEISSAPIQKRTPCVKSKEVTSDSDSDDDDNDNEVGAQALCNGHCKDGRTNNSSVSQQLMDLHISDKNTQCEPNCSQTETRENAFMKIVKISLHQFRPPMLAAKKQEDKTNQDKKFSSIPSQTQGQGEEGWEVVRRSKKR